MDFITLKMLLEQFMQDLEKYELIEEIQEEQWRDNPMYSHPARVKRTVTRHIRRRST